MKGTLRGAFSGAAELRFPASGNLPQSVAFARAGCSTPSTARKKSPQGGLFLVPLNCGFPQTGTLRRGSLALARGVRPLPRHTKKRPQGALFLVPLIGVEPIRYRYHRILSPARLPIPPQRQAIRLYNTIAEKSSVFTTLVFHKFNVCIAVKYIWRGTNPRHMEIQKENYINYVTHSTL